jgi:hypothetical protein
VRALRIISSTLIAAAIVNFAIAAWDLATGGFHVRLFGVRFSSWELYKPLTYATAATVVGLWIHDRAAGAAETSWNGLSRRSGWIVVAVAIVFVGVAVRWGVDVAGGPDAYGYVSEAIALAAGHLAVPNRLAALTPAIGPSTAPIAYTLSRVPGHLAPVYPPGYPMLMAAALTVGGGGAVYLVAPLFGGLAIWLTYVVGAQIADRRIGCLAAVLFAFSPIVLFHGLVPMSDLPAAALWLLVLTFALQTGDRSALAAGLAASAAVLVRPNLVPLALAVFVAIWLRSGVRRAAVFAAGVLPSCLAIAALHWYFRGSPLRSGYGRLDALFQVGYFGANVRHYFTWLIDLHTPAILVALAAPLTGRIRFGSAIALFASALLLCYAFYVPFDNWPFLRFLLPGIPLLFIFFATIVVAGLERLPLIYRGGVAFAVCGVCTMWMITKSTQIGVFEVARGERRYLTVAETIDRTTPRNAVVLSMIHSGTVRLYGHRMTLRWDLIEPERLVETVEILRANGLVPYILLEDWEERQFRERFGGRVPFGQVDWPPQFEFIGNLQVRLYSLEDRERYLRGDRLHPRMIPG